MRRGQAAQRAVQIALRYHTIVTHDANGEDRGVWALLPDQPGDERAVPGIGVEDALKRIDTHAGVVGEIG